MAVEICQPVPSLARRLPASEREHYLQERLAIFYHFC
jgi:hypothetical protein